MHFKILLLIFYSWTQKTSEITEVIMLMVEHIEKNWHQIFEELGRWRNILISSWEKNKYNNSLKSKALTII